MCDAIALYITKMDIPFECTIQFLVNTENSSIFQRGMLDERAPPAAFPGPQAFQGEAHQLSGGALARYGRTAALLRILINPRCPGKVV